MYTYFLDENSNLIPRGAFGNTLEEVYPGVVTVIEVSPHQEGWDAVKITKVGSIGWIPREYRLVDNNDLTEILEAFSV